MVRMPLSVTSYCRNVHFFWPVCGSMAITVPWPTTSVQLLIGVVRPMRTPGAPGTGVTGLAPPPAKLRPGTYSAGSFRKIDA